MKNRNDDLKVLQCVTGRCALQKVNSIFAKKKAQNIIVQCWTVYYIWNIVQDKTHHGTMNLRERVSFKLGNWDMRITSFMIGTFHLIITKFTIVGSMDGLLSFAVVLNFFFPFFYLCFRSNRLLPNTCIMTQCSSLWRNHCTSSLYGLIKKLNLSYAVPPSFWWYNIIP